MAKKFTFTRKEITELRASLNAALKSVEREYGLNIGIGTIRFTDSECSFKCTAVSSVPGKQGVSPTIVKAEQDWERNAHLFGFKNSWLGKEFVYKGKKAKVLGLMTNRPKYPVLIEQGGKQLLLQVNSLIFAMKP